MHSDPVPAHVPSVLGVVADRVGYLFAKLHQRWVAESMAALRGEGLGLSGLHFGALSVLEAAGPMPQRVLGEHLGKDRTTMVSVIDELEEGGLVERRRNPDDRRAYALELTSAGLDWMSRARPVLLAAENELLAELDPDERAALVSLLQRTLFGA